MTDQIDKAADELGLKKEPDFDAIERIAWAYFGLHFQRFMSLPRQELQRLMEVAGIESETALGLLGSIRRLSCAYFGDRIDSVLSLSTDELGRLMDHAGVERARVVGLLKALRSLDANEELRRRVLQ